MKTLILRSLIIAILIGPALTLLNSVLWTHVHSKYDPPISQSEIQQWKKLTAGEMELKFIQREVPFSKVQWLSESIHYSYFWRDLAKTSCIPTAGVFFACFWAGRMERHSRTVASGERVSNPSAA